MKKVLLVILSMLILVSAALTGCVRKPANDENTIEVYMFKGGYGTKFLEEMAKKFEEKNPGIKVDIRGDSVVNKSEAMLKAGPNNTTTDLFFVAESPFKWIASGNRFLSGYENILENLNDVYDHELPDGRTIAEKMNPQFLNDAKVTTYDDYGMAHDDYYSMSWSGGLNGLIYNKTLFDQLELDIPRTTDELIELADTIKSKDKVPFVLSTQTFYTSYIENVWWAQYEGLDGYIRYWEGKDINNEYNISIYSQPGRLKSLEVVEQMVSPVYERSHTNINGMSFSEAQTQFLLGNGLMMVNGDWFENETNVKVNSDYEFRIMRTPILSDMAVNKAPSILNDDMLKDVVDYVDGVVTTKPSGVTDADIDLIAEARKIVSTLGTDHNAFIPTYAKAKDAAKEFLKYMATDEALEIYMKNTGGANLPFDYDITNDNVKDLITPFQQSKFEIYNDAVFLPNRNKYPLVFSAGHTTYSGRRNNPVVLLAVKNADERKTALQIFNEEINAHSVSGFNSMLMQAGLL